MDFIDSKTLLVEIQENGIIRNQHGWIIARLNAEVDYNRIDQNGNPKYSIKEN